MTAESKLALKDLTDRTEVFVKENIERGALSNEEILVEARSFWIQLSFPFLNESQVQVFLTILHYRGILLHHRARPIPDAELLEPHLVNQLKLLRCAVLESDVLDQCTSTQREILEQEVISDGLWRAPRQ